MYHYNFKDSVINRCSYCNVRYLKQTQEAPKKHGNMVKIQRNKSFPLPFLIDYLQCFLLKMMEN